MSARPRRLARPLPSCSDRFVDRAPHYLRVVQALALVSGFGAVTIVAGVTVVDCSTTSEAGPGGYQDTDGGGVAGYDDGSVADTGRVGL